MTDQDVYHDYDEDEKYRLLEEGTHIITKEEKNDTHSDK